MKREISLFVVGIVVASALVIIGITFVTNNLLKRGGSKKSDTASCQQPGQTHLVNIQNNMAEPAHVTAKLCDNLTFTNNGTRAILLAFGEHDDHVFYDGVSEKSLNRGESFTVTLNKAGTFKFHDHIGDVSKGDFTVTK